jgi:glycosyltransferase involved in cell wall biosynthesis
MSGRGDRRHSVVWVSTSLDTRGGIASLVRSMRGTPLWDEWNIRHISTHRNGSVAVRVATFVAGTVRFGWEVLAHRPDLVHLHTASYGSFARKALIARLCRYGRIPYIVQVHGGEFVRFHDRSPRWVQRLITSTLSSASCVLALGDTWAKRLTDIAPQARVQVAPNGVRLGIPVPQRTSSGGVHFLFLGDVRPEKGVYVLVEAWARLLSTTHAAATLTIGGDGELAAVQERVDVLGVADSVVVSGWVPPDRVPDLIRSAQVLVLPSRHEGQPMAILEAMAQGLCIVASDVGGIPDMVDAECGLLVPADDVAALETALRTVLDDDERSRRGQRAWERVASEFDVTLIAGRMDSVYRSAVDGGLSSRRLGSRWLRTTGKDLSQQPPAGRPPAPHP